MKRHLAFLCVAIGAFRFGAIPADAATLSVGPYMDTATDPFIVPVEVDGAVDLASFAFDVDVDATAYTIDTACDPFGDTHCDFATGPVTPGTLSPNAAMDPPLFDPGFILLDVSPDGPIPVAGSPTPSGPVDEPFVPGLMAAGVLAFVFEQRRARASRRA